MDSIIEDIRTFIASRIREGFDSVHEIVEEAEYYAQEKYERDDLKPRIQRLLAEALEEHRAEQAEWDSPTDCDRLDEAFAALNQQGIVARQNFSCCNNCGHTEIWDEIEEAEERQPVEGYVFYHLQCTERAIETGQLLLAYGCVEESKVALTNVANKVVAELRRVGLDASWTEGDYPIVVDGIVWRKRR